MDTQIDKSHLLKVLEVKCGLTKIDKKNWQEYWSYSDEEIDDKWLDKLMMHAFPVRPPTLILDMQPWDAFRSPSTGKMITSKAQRREDMKASGCRDWEGMKDEKAHAASCKKYEEVEQDKKLEAAAVDVWRNMSQSKKDLLLKS